MSLGKIFYSPQNSEEQILKYVANCSFKNVKGMKLKVLPGNIALVSGLTQTPRVEMGIVHSGSKANLLNKHRCFKYYS